ncbi:hypothetical protein DYB28_007445 [Aphanomyces astaci]|uniref:Uncharacterized protein n=1 Tax=Aphanomyces astaci TaxID=112090 RepID=A0A397FAU1_APHAT|nr:hypothetical protein DYB38_006514 [Aphanomyces astaci]RHZ03581.1 hypothetical protein DYB26_005484 [Aphanomyces astaci]RHZ16663.1 hypothetical protein DYB31_007385 [Aphanomyces astaci]RLO03526.1 hypothetical protein DYB28_007445 [Aphanomyces astaci]
MAFLSPSELKASLSIQVPCATHTVDARWGCDEPPSEELCQEYKPNVFRKGFCMNCQKRHDVSDDGHVASTKSFVRIHSPAMSPHAARAELNPLAEHSDLSVALTQAREDALMRLHAKDELKHLSTQLEALRRDLEAAPNTNALECKLQELDVFEKQLVANVGRASPQS